MERKPNKIENRAVQKYTINNIDDIKLTNECKWTQQLLEILVLLHDCSINYSLRNVPYMWAYQSNVQAVNA